jgi:hypothetical protein
MSLVLAWASACDDRLVRSNAGRAKPARPTIALNQIWDGFEYALGNFGNYELCDSVSPADDECLGPMIDQDDPNLPAIITIDCPRSVQDGYAKPQRQTGSRPDLAFIAIGKGNTQACWRQTPPAWLDLKLLALWNGGAKVEPRRARCRFEWEIETLAMRQDLQWDNDTQDRFSSSITLHLWMIALATSALLCLGSVSTASGVIRWTLLSRPPITPDSGLTSLATIISQRFRASLA